MMFRGGSVVLVGVSSIVLDSRGFGPVVCEEFDGDEGYKGEYGLLWGGVVFFGVGRGGIVVCWVLCCYASLPRSVLRKDLVCCSGDQVEPGCLRRGSSVAYYVLQGSAG
jgi:hypothetical protein